MQWQRSIIPLRAGLAGALPSTTLNDPNPYDGSDDMLVGVINNSSNTYASLHIAGVPDQSYNGGIFAFDGDGVCSGVYTSECYSAYPNDDVGAGVTGFKIDLPVINSYGWSILNSGDVHFSGLGPGDTAFFSLEEAPAGTAGTPIVVTTTTPEPVSLILFSTFLGLAGLARRRKS